MDRKGEVDGKVEAVGWTWILMGRKRKNKRKERIKRGDG